jgi:hypothetical protein
MGHGNTEYLLSAIPIESRKKCVVESPRRFRFIFKCIALDPHIRGGVIRGSESDLGESALAYHRRKGDSRKRRNAHKIYIPVIEISSTHVGHDNLVLSLLQATLTEETLLVLLVVGCGCFIGVRPECFDRPIVQLHASFYKE